MIRRALFTVALLACSAGTVSAQVALTTLFASNNGGAIGGALYFDLTVKVKTSLQALDCNFGQAANTPVGLLVFITPDTRVGKEGDVSLWDQVGEDDGSAFAAGTDLPTRITLAKAISLKPGTYGVALVGVDAEHDYTNGNGTNQNFEDGFLAIATGAASNVPFTGAEFEPRVWNGRLIYGPKSVKGPFLYAYDDASGAIHGYLLDKKSGAPGELLSSPFAVSGGGAGCGGNCQTLTADPKGTFVFAATGSGLSVLARLEGGEIEEVPGSPFAGTSGLIGVAAWRSGSTLRVFAVANGTSDLNVFDIDPETGEATLQANPPAIGTDGGGVGIVVTKGFVYAANQDDANIHGFAIDADTGALTPIPGSPFSIVGIGDPFNLSVDSKGTVLAVNDCSDGDYGFAAIDKTTGALLFPVVLAGGSSCSEVFGYTKKGIFYGGGDAVVDVYDTTPALVSSPAVPSGGIDLGLITSKGTSIYYFDGSNLRHVPVDKKTLLPIAAAANSLINTLAIDANGMIVLSK